MSIVETIELSDLKLGLAQGKILLIDVREDDEYADGHVAGALLRPLSRFDVGNLPPPSDKTIVMICRSGRRSAAALEMAQAQGRHDMRLHYLGGMLGWGGAGEPIAKGDPAPNS